MRFSLGRGEAFSCNLSVQILSVNCADDSFMSKHWTLSVGHMVQQEAQNQEERWGEVTRKDYRKEVPRSDGGAEIPAGQTEHLRAGVRQTPT